MNFLEKLIFFIWICSDCVDIFGVETIEPIRRDDSVICETQFSKVVPLEDGEVKKSKWIFTLDNEWILIINHSNLDCRVAAEQPAIGHQLLQLDGVARMDQSHQHPFPTFAP